jgi:basic membrane lipoprotein Med (substrate-binding protein (PBP1-ABC) superfamily)
LSKPLVLALAAFAAITMIAAGCGGGGDSTTDSSSLTKAEFLKQGNAVCAKGNKEIEEGFKDFEKENGLQNKQPTEAQLTEAIETIVLPAVRDQVDGIEALGAPSGEEEKVESITDAASEAVDEGEDDPASLTSEKADPFAKANELANEYGLVKCGE